MNLFSPIFICINQICKNAKFFLFSWVFFGGGGFFFFFFWYFHPFKFVSQFNTLYYFSAEVFPMRTKTIFRGLQSDDVETLNDC